jgi:hypothetical protein
MGYYIIWLASVKEYLVLFWELKRKTTLRSGHQHGRFKTRSLRTQGCGTLFGSLVVVFA